MSPTCWDDWLTLDALDGSLISPKTHKSEFSHAPHEQLMCNQIEYSGCHSNLGILILYLIFYSYFRLPSKYPLGLTITLRCSCSRCRCFWTWYLCNCTLEKAHVNWLLKCVKLYYNWLLWRSLIHTVCRTYSQQIFDFIELTGWVVPCFKTAAWYLAIFSLVDDKSVTLSDAGRPKADEEITLYAVNMVAAVL